MKRRKKVPSNHFKNIFDNPRSKSFILVNDFLALVTLVSIAAIVLETVAYFEPYRLVFQIIEYTTAAIFTLEYYGRLHAAKKKWSYVFSFFGIVDLIAILPTYLGLANLTFLKSARALRIIRFLRIIRLTKLARIPKKEASSLYKLNLQIYALAFLATLLILGTLFYIFEASHAEAQDIPSAMFWVFKAIMRGLPYDQPETLGGTVTLVSARFVSMILLGMMLSLVGTIMRKLLIGSEKDS